MIGIVGITAETLHEIVRNLKEFQPLLSVQINVFTALAAFIKDRPSCRRKIYMNWPDGDDGKILRSNIDGLIDLMVLHRKKIDLRLQISVCEMLPTQGIYKEVMFSYRQRMVNFLLDQIANTHGIKALASIKLLLEACKIGIFSSVRREIVTYNGNDVIFEYIRKDFTCKDS